MSDRWDPHGKPDPFEKRMFQWLRPRCWTRSGTYCTHESRARERCGLPCPALADCPARKLRSAAASALFVLAAAQEDTGEDYEPNITEIEKALGWPRTKREGPVRKRGKEKEGDGGRLPGLEEGH